MLVGIRGEEVISLYPAAAPEDAEPLRAQCAALAIDLAEEGFSVGVGTQHPGGAGIAAGYREASEAAEIALRTGSLGTPMAFEDVLIDHIVRSSPHADLLVQSLEPLREYDERRGSSLMETLGAYFSTGFNLTRSAELLHVHPIPWSTGCGGWPS